MAGDLPNGYSDVELALASTHFGAVTPENCMKPERIHPVMAIGSLNVRMRSAIGPKRMG